MNKIQLKNISRHRTQNVGLFSLSSQPDHGEHVIRWTLLFLYMYRCRSEGWIILGDRTKGKTKRYLVQIKLHHPRHQPHGTAGPNTGGNGRLFHQCSLESTDTLPKRTTKQLGGRSPSGLSTQQALQRNGCLEMAGLARD